jgi:outer membrane receptor protein involved in Fe transport
MKHKLSMVAASVAFVCSLGSGAFAQEQQVDSQADESAIEKISVTGSRIKRADFSTPQPLVGFSKDDIVSIGSSDITDALLEIPSVIGGVTPQGSTGNIQNNGIRTADLRGLGDNRTLVLIDGRRAVSNSANGNRVGLGTIPAGFVERVEVITGGASAVYGSDAVAGVVNIITETDQEGFELDVRGQYSNALDSSDQTIDFSWGGSFNEGKGYLFSAINLDTRTAIRARNVPRSLIQADFQYDDGINTFVNSQGDRIPFSQIDNFDTFDFGDLSADPDGGRFEGNDFFFDENGLQRGFVTDTNGFDLRADDDLNAARDRVNFAIKGTYDFTDDFSGFFTLTHSFNSTLQTREPEGDDFNDVHFLVLDDSQANFTAINVPIGAIPIDNPFAPAEIVQEAGSNISFDRRFTEVGTQLTDNDRNTTRFYGGLRGLVWDDWEWEASVGYGRYNSEQTRFNEINVINLTAGLNAEQLPDGTIQCADATDRANGCVPVNLFGRGSITPEAADFIRANLFQDATVEQYSFQAYITGDLFELPAGTVGSAFGIDFRRDFEDLQPGELNRRGGHTSGTVPQFDDGYNVWEAFGEVSIPLVADAPGAYNWSVDTSARVANYSIENVGTVFSFGVGTQYQPVEELNFRLSFNRALRAPDLAELFSPPRGDNDGINDVCEGVTLADAGSSTLADNCLAEPGIVGFINTLAQEDPTLDINQIEFEQENGGVSSPNTGFIGLKEEEADTITIGVVWQPSYIEGFSLSVDYYDIEIEDAIDQRSNQDILNLCYTDPIDFRNGNNPFCNDITRNEVDGQLANILQREANLAAQETSGVDYQLNYEFSLDGQGIPGKFEARYIHTHLIKFTETTVNLDGTLNVDNQKGELVNERFEDRGRFSLAWSHNDWRVTWRTTYFGSTFDSNELLEDFLDAQEEFGDAAEVPAFLNIDRVLFHNLTARYSTQIGNVDTRFTIGVNNITNNEGPFIPDGDAASGEDSNSADAFGIRGRSFFARVNLRF